MNNKNNFVNKIENIKKNNKIIILNKESNTNESIEQNKNFEISNQNSFNINENNILKKDDKSNNLNDNNKNSDENKNKNENEDEAKIYNILSDLNEYSPSDKEIKFDINLYKKPDIYYPLKHDQYIIPQIKDYPKGNSTFIPKVRSFQQVINEKIRFINQIESPKINIISKNPKKSYENKMDVFFVKSTLNNFRLQQRLKSNINAYYDIGFPEELKAADLDPKF